MNEDDIKQQEQTYEDIIEFYDFAEDLIDTVENKSVQDPISQLEFVEPLVEQVENATDVLAEEYREYMKTGKTPGFLARRKIAKAMKALYSAMGKCKKEQEKALKKAMSMLAALVPKTLKKHIMRANKITSLLGRQGLLGDKVTLPDVINYSKKTVGGQFTQVNSEIESSKGNKKRKR